MSYYFLVASLPALKTGEAPSISLEGLLELCDKQLSKKDELALKQLLAFLAPEIFAKAETKPLQLTDFSKSPCGFLRKWSQKEIQLRNAVATARATALSKDVTPYLHKHQVEYDVSQQTSVTTAFQQSSPLEREKLLDKLRLQLLEELVLGANFSMASVLAYTIQLHIQLRWSSMDEASGRKKLEELVNSDQLLEQNNKPQEATA